MEKLRKVSFEDTDKDLDIEIYGETFKLNENKLININVDEVRENENELETLLEDILGKGSIEKNTALLIFLPPISLTYQ